MPTGAGGFDAGSGPGGQDPVPAPTPRPVQILPLAPEFDPYNRVYVIGADGQLVGQHPVIHRAAHLLGIVKGTLPARPDMGFDLAAMKLAIPDTRQRVAEDCANGALASLIKANQLKVLRVTLQNPWIDTMWIDVVNLLDPNVLRDPRLAQAIFQRSVT